MKKTISYNKIMGNNIINTIVQLLDETMDTSHLEQISFMQI